MRPIDDEYEVLSSSTERTPRRRRSRRRRLLIALATVVVLLGVATIAAVSYVGSVPLPESLTLPESTTVYYADGRTVMARLGEENRHVVDYGDMDEAVTHAVVAARDPDFWESSVSGITREVVRMTFDLRGDSMSTRARVAVAAYKLEGARPKEEILGTYLNAVPFGRKTFGVEAAAQEFFGKSADRRVAAEKRIGWAEAALLAAMIGQPNPDPDDPDGSPGFDPTLGPKALENAKARWAEIRDAMVELGYLSRADADRATFPSSVVKVGKAGVDLLTQPTGLVVHHALSELRSTPAFKGKSKGYLENGGFRIVTTINQRAQAALQRTADETTQGSAMAGQPKNLQAAGVMVEPGTGRVLAYYGGHDGLGADFAGWFVDSDGVPVGYGAHPPGATFFVHTLAAALKGGVSVKSRWDSPAAKEFPEAGRVTGQGGPVRNSGTAKCQPACTLADAVTAPATLNVPFFGVTLSVGSANVLATARDAGIDDMWDARSTRQHLADADLTTVAAQSFGAELGLGQYGVTVLDQANAVATYAAGGVRSPAHFVRQVLKDDEVVYQEPSSQTRVLNPAQAADLTWALSRTTAGRLALGGGSASRTAVWGMTKDPAKNAHAWIVGYTTKLAMAVWVGNRGEEQTIRDQNGVMINGTGLPATIYRKAMTDAHTAMALRPGTFAPPAYTGRIDAPGSLPG